MRRRQFLINSFITAGIASTGISCASLKRQSPSKGSSQRQEFYELRAYRMKAGANPRLLLSYLQDAAIPAYNRLGSSPIGVFREMEQKDPAVIFVLIPHESLQAFSDSQSRLAKDSAYRQAAAAYLNTDKNNPAYERIDTWLLKAFAGMPRIELAAHSKARVPTRLFEMRTYESFSEEKAARKVAMFNNGEIELMREVGLAPVFFGEGLVGANLPHLTYMTSADTEAAHKQHWDAFVKHPKWDQMKNDPQYADTVSKNTKWFLVPAPGSQI